MTAAQHGWQRAGWRVGLLAADVSGAGLAFWVASGAVTGTPTALQVWAAVALLSAWLLTALRHPGFLPRPHRPLITTASQCLLATATGSGLWVVLLYVATPEGLAARELLLPATAVMFACRVISRHLAGALASREAFGERYLLIGNGERSRAIAEELSNGRHPYQHVVGLLAFDAAQPAPEGVAVLPGSEPVSSLIERLRVTHAIVCQLQPLSDEAARCVTHCEVAGVEVHSMEAAYETFTRRVPLFHVGDQWIASLEASAHTLYATRVKRLLDIVVSALGLLLLWPLILLLALLVRLSSKGPAFYRQERIGRHGRPFTFTKLRTMVDDAEAVTGPVWAAEGDPRITPLGRFLRKSRLDEMPQLWSVLIGDMSLVGPRPERKHFVDRFLEEIPLYGKRLLVPPGITGWAQVHHTYDTSVEDVIEKLRYDLFYVNHVSVKLDLLILLKTFDVVLRGRGAR